MPLLLEEAEVALLGDGEYDTVEMLTWVTTCTNWQYVVRTSKSNLITHDGQQYALRDLCGGHGSITCAQNALFTLQEFRSVMAVAWWGKQYDDPIFLISNCASPALACDYYHCRFRVETLFSDKKSRGFHIEKSHLSDPS